MKKKHIFLMVAIAIIVLLIIYRSFVPGSGIEKQKQKLEETKQEILSEKGGEMRMAAYNAAVQYITQNLKSPATAQFSKTWDDATIISNIDSLFTVQLQVDAQNSYGALVRNTYTARMVFNKQTGNWTLVSLR